MQPTNAALYIRTSTEMQALKVSPETQEADCRAYCAAPGRGYSVADQHVYRDIAQYRVGKRLVEPSGSRNDRPAWLKMLADLDAGLFSVIIAWREDRLYRGYRPMLEIVERVEHGKLRVELVKEIFDPTMAPIKAWAARQELKARSERTAMGRAARYADDKHHPGNVPYGYKLIAPDPVKPKDKQVIIDEAEAQWVRAIYAWYLAGVSFNAMRRQLIAGGAPQRQATSFGKGIATPWAKGVLQKILTNPTYASGKMIVTMRETTGQQFTLTMPIIIDAETWTRALAQRKHNKSSPIHHVKHNYLAGGLVYCKTCGVKLGGKTRARHGHVYAYYTCSRYDASTTDRSQGCCQSVSVRKLDRELWARTWRIMTDDEFFNTKIQAKIDALRAIEANAATELEKHQAALDDIAMRRAVVIDLHARKKITEADLDLQLASIDLDTLHHRKRVSELSLLSGDRADRLLAYVNTYREKIRAGGDYLNLDPCPPELAQRQFELRREIVEGVVERIEARPDKSIEIMFVFDLAAQWGLTDQDNSPLREFIGGSSLKDFKLWAHT